MTAEISVTPSNIDVLINQIKTACDLESLTDARATIRKAARAWSRVHKQVKQVKQYRLELLRLEVQALVRIVELGGIDTLTPADQKAAQALAQMSEAERAQLIAESGTSTTAAGMMRTLWRTQELESENAIVTFEGVSLPRLITATTEEGVYVRIPVENARLCDFAEMIEQRQVQLEQDRARINALSEALAHLRMIAGADDGSRIGDLLALDLIGGAA